MNGKGESLAGMYVRDWFACWAVLVLWYERAPRSFASFISWYIVETERRRG
jgi:hypothetical protein